jgi:hypothetical protein
VCLLWDVSHQTHPVMNGRLDLARVEHDAHMNVAIEVFKRIYLDDLSGKISYVLDLKELFTNCVHKRVPQTTNEDDWAKIEEITIDLFDKATVPTISLVNEFVPPPYLDCDAARVTIAHSWLQAAQDDADIKRRSSEYDVWNEQYDQESQELSRLEIDLQNPLENANLQSASSREIFKQAINEKIQVQRLKVEDLSNVS